MSVWYSEMGHTVETSDGTKTGTRTVIVNGTTGSQGEFSIDLTAYEISEIIDYSVKVVAGPITDILEMAFSSVTQITETLVAGVVAIGNQVTVSLGNLIKPIKRVGSGIQVQVTIICI